MGLLLFSLLFLGCFALCTSHQTTQIDPALIGMVMGALIGAAHGSARIPQHLKDGLKDRELRDGLHAVRCNIIGNACGRR